MNCHNYRDHLGILYTVAGNFLPIKHGMWHGVDEIVDACMNISVLLAHGIHLQQKFSTVRHSRESPQGDEHRRCSLGVLE